MATVQKLEIKASIKILKQPPLVFDAIVNPSKMSHYFISRSSGRMEEGKTVNWKFPELDMEFPVNVLRVEADKFIAFTWKDVDGTETTTEITLKAFDDDETVVSIVEKSRDNDEDGINWLRRNTEGWANFLACLKAYLEYGINLRRGAFDISQMPEFHQ